MHILITGAAGFIGSHLAEQLDARGHQVRGLDCTTSYYDVSLKQQNTARLRRRGIEVLPLDLATDPLEPAVRGIEVVYHLAAQPGLSSETPPATFMRNNVRATSRLLDVLSGHPRLRAFIYASSSSVYGAEAKGDESSEPRPISIYGKTKLRAERLIRSRAQQESWSSSILRLFSVYGPRERPDKLFHKLIRCTLTGKRFPLYEGSADHHRSFTYVGDIVKAFLCTLDRLGPCAGQTINIGSATSVSTAKGIDTVRHLLDKPVRTKLLPPRQGDQQATWAVIEKARRLLNFAPTTSLEDGLTAEITWLQQRL